MTNSTDIFEFEDEFMDEEHDIACECAGCMKEELEAGYELERRPRGRFGHAEILRACLPERISGQDKFFVISKTAGMFRDTKKIETLCRGGLWYMPGRGRILLSVARWLLRKSDSDMSVSKYLDKVRDHPFNRQFRRKTGRRWPTRAFLPRWKRNEGRTYVGRGGGYGLIFFPPPDDQSMLAVPY